MLRPIKSRRSALASCRHANRKPKNGDNDDDDDEDDDDEVYSAAFSMPLALSLARAVISHCAISAAKPTIAV